MIYLMLTVQVNNLYYQPYWGIEIHLQVQILCSNLGRELFHFCMFLTMPIMPQILFIMLV